MTRKFLYNPEDSCSLSPAPAVTEVEVNGNRILTDGVNLWKPYPMLNVFSGETWEIWLTHLQEQTFQKNAATYPAPDPRVFDLAQIGFSNAPQGLISLPSPDEKLVLPSEDQFLFGWTLISSRQPVLCDNNGVWWKMPSPSPSVLRMMPGVYLGPNQEMKFLYPMMSVLGTDPADLWVKTRGNMLQTRITVATNDVAGVIHKAGMWGHYFPIGKAMRDPEVTRAEIEHYRGKMTGELTTQIEVLTAEKAILVGNASRLETIVQENQKLMDSLREDLRATEKRTEAALARAEAAEEALALARATNEGWDWSRVLGDG